MKTQQLVAQIKREFWENKVGFLIAPVVVTALLFLIVCIGLIKFASTGETGINVKFENGSEQIDRNVTSAELVEKMATEGPDIYARAIEGIVFINTSFLCIVFFIIVFSYAHSCLFEDRKNRDILFWRSMPISETMNVLVKVAIILLYFPMAILALNVVAVSLSLVGSIAYFVAQGIPFGYLISSVIQGGEFFILIKVFGVSLIYMLLLLPVIGFIFLASTYAKKSPFVVTLLGPTVLILVDKTMNYLTGINLHVIDTLRSYWNLFMTARYTLESGSPASFDVVSTVGYLISIVIGILLVSAAIWMRNHRYEI